MEKEKLQHLSETKQSLTTKYGVVLGNHQLADLLDTSPANLQNMMRRQSSAIIRYLRYYRRRPGRKIVYLAARVAEALVLSDSELERRLRENSERESDDD